MIFRDRADAGRQLAQRLSQFRNADVIVLALPRGGVVVGYEVAQALEAPLDVLVARKLGAPGNPELGIGAIAPGVTVLDDRAVRALGITSGELERIAADETREMARRRRRFRGDLPPPVLTGRTVLLVDDGIATGVTARAAIRSIRGENPRRLILAVPVAAPETVATLRAEVDDLVCLHMPQGFHAIGQFYVDFAQTSDEEVVELLDRAHQEVPLERPPSSGFERPVERGGQPRTGGGTAGGRGGHRKLEW